VSPPARREDPGDVHRHPALLALLQARQPRLRQEIPAARQQRAVECAGRRRPDQPHNLLRHALVVVLVAVHPQAHCVQRPRLAQLHQPLARPARPRGDGHLVVALVAVAALPRLVAVVVGVVDAQRMHRLDAQPIEALFQRGVDASG